MHKVCYRKCVKAGESRSELKYNVYAITWLRLLDKDNQFSSK